MELQPGVARRGPGVRGVQFIQYGTTTRSTGAEFGGGRLPPRGRARRPSSGSGTRRGSRPSAPPPYSFSELAFNLCSEEHCPDAKSNPAVQDHTLRQATAYAIDRERNNEIATQGTSFVAHGLLPSFYKAFFEVPELDYPYDPEIANQLLDDAGWALNEDGIREKDGRSPSLPVRPLRVAVRGRSRMAKLIAEQAQRDRDRIRPPGDQHRQAHRAHDPDGGRQAGAGLRLVHLGLGRRPYDPSFLLSLITTE